MPESITGRHTINIIGSNHSAGSTRYSDMPSKELKQEGTENRLGVIWIEAKKDMSCLRN